MISIYIAIGVCLSSTLAALIVSTISIRRINRYLSRFDNYVDRHTAKGNWITPGEIPRSVIIPEDKEDQ